MACAQAFAHTMPLCCKKHEDEFKAEFLRVLDDCMAVERDAHRRGRGRRRAPSSALRDGVNVYIITLEGISTDERAE